MNDSSGDDAPSAASDTRSQCIVRTILGDVPPDALGIVLGHEHLMARPPNFVTDEDLQLDSEDAALAELNAFSSAAGSSVVEMTTVDYGRDIAALVRLAHASGVHIISATGFNQGRFADDIVARLSDEQIVAWMVFEVRSGALPYQPPEAFRLSDEDPAWHNATESLGAAAHRPRAGLIKASSGSEGPGAGELRVLKAAAEAHRQTHAPIGTHTEKAAWGLEQAQFFCAAGVPAHNVLIGHLDFRPELPYLLEVAATGVNLGLDQFSKHKYLSDRKRVELIVGLAAAGHLSQVIMSGDLARRSYWPGYGNATASGFAHIPGVVREMLLAEGLGDNGVRQLLEGNPQRWLGFDTLAGDKL